LSRALTSVNSGQLGKDIEPGYKVVLKGTAVDEGISTVKRR
jgi:hypothetical protein